MAFRRNYRTHRLTAASLAAVTLLTAACSGAGTLPVDRNGLPAGPISVRWMQAAGQAVLPRVQTVLPAGWRLSRRARISPGVRRGGPDLQRDRRPDLPVVFPQAEGARLAVRHRQRLLIGAA